MTSKFGQTLGILVHFIGSFKQVLKADLEIINNVSASFTLL